MKDQHQAALMTAQQESAKATEEHLATKAALEKAMADVEAHKTATETTRKTAKSDYSDMHDSMTQLVEEANKKAEDAVKQAEEAKKQAAAKESLVAELKANLKVKDAELAEAKVRLRIQYLRNSVES
jgi:hypothetical protein